MGKQACAPRRGAPAAGRPVAVRRPSAPTHGPGAQRWSSSDGRVRIRPGATGHWKQLKHHGQSTGPWQGATAGGGPRTLLCPYSGSEKRQQTRVGPGQKKEPGHATPAQRAAGVDTGPRCLLAGQPPPGGLTPPTPCPCPEGGQHCVLRAPGGPVPASPGSQAACSCPFPASPPPVGPGPVRGLSRGQLHTRLGSLGPNNLVSQDLGSLPHTRLRASPTNRSINESLDTRPSEETDTHMTLQANVTSSRKPS